MGDQQTRRRAYGSQLGWAYLAQGNLLTTTDGDYRTTRTAYERALAVMRATAERAGEGNVLVKLGQLLQHNESPDEALATYQQAQKILGDVGDHVGLCMANIAMARMHLAAEDLATAQTHAEQAVQMAKDSHHDEGTQTALGLSGEIALQRGEFALAAEQLTAAATMIRTTGMHLPLARMLFLLGQEHAALGDRPTGIATAKESLTLYKSLDRPEQNEVNQWLLTIETSG